MASGSMISCVTVDSSSWSGSVTGSFRPGSSSSARSHTVATAGSARSNRLVTMPTRRSPPADRPPSGRSAIVSSSRSHSSALHASGPTVSSDQAVGTTPRDETSPQLGRMPVTPQKAAGIRTEPAVSVPSAASTRPAATAAPLPPLEPPQMCSGFHGLSAGPKWGLVVEAPYANSWVLSFPAIVAPAARRRATHSASSAGTRCSTFDAAVVGMPATSMTSLTPITGPPLPGWGSRWRNALNGSSVTASPPQEDAPRARRARAGCARGSRARPPGLRPRERHPARRQGRAGAPRLGRG